MMKAILGSALGGVVAGVVALLATAQGRAPEPSWSQTAPSASPYAMTVADTSAAHGVAMPSSPAVQCEPHQSAVLQRSFMGGREVAQVTCVDRALVAPAAAYPPPAYAAPVAAPVYYPPAAAAPDIVQRPAVRTVRPRTQRVVQTREDVAPKRSWKKSALVIGGSAATGAGVGALAGGKKGALIGAAIGGGGGAIYEAIKRR